mmetsp:Transcript_13546/g.41125  ORF Transcript_13546/g.41125 Transcript_13546/m.41125 type:complete len:100 (+) Transcript_13546:522-821(+)
MLIESSRTWSVLAAIPSLSRALNTGGVLARPLLFVGNTTPFMHSACACTFVSQSDFLESFFSFGLMLISSCWSLPASLHAAGMPLRSATVNPDAFTPAR